MAQESNEPQGRNLGQVGLLIQLASVGDSLGASWITSAIKQGFTRAFAAKIDSLAPGLAGVECFEGIILILQQIISICREGNMDHVRCARCGNEIVVLVSAEERFDWVLPSVESRLRQEMAGRSLEFDQAQRVDLARGEKLRFGSVELQLVSDGSGGFRVKTKQVPMRNATAPIVEPSGLAIPPCAKRFAKLRAFMPALHYTKLHWTYGARALGACQARFQWLTESIRQRKLIWRDWVGLGFGLATLVLTAVLVRELYAAFPHEFALPDMPPGFFEGCYPTESEEDPGCYYLYIPPNLTENPGPYPLLMCLHSIGIKTKNDWNKEGLGRSIEVNVRKGKRCDFMVFIPIDRGKNWKAPEVENAMLMLEHIISRHNIDPKRIYLTGSSSGGFAVWRVAAKYPDKWAAIAPIASVEANVERIKHIPCWMFHGLDDGLVPVQRAEATAERLKNAGSEVRFTAYPNMGHSVWRLAYDQELFDWLLSKSRQ